MGDDFASFGECQNGFDWWQEPAASHLPNFPQDVELKPGKWHVEYTFDWDGEQLSFASVDFSPLYDLLRIPEKRIREILGG